MFPDTEQPQNFRIHFESFDKVRRGYRVVRACLENQPLVQPRDGFFLRLRFYAVLVETVVFVEQNPFAYFPAQGVLVQRVI